jgi:decaprenylphospho-beta-D-ribofuranose 2-oxidase
MISTFELDSQVDFISFDGGVLARGALAKPSQSALRELSDIEEKVLSGKKARITRGAGLSFAANHFGDGIVTVDNSRFTEIIEYDPETGQLEVQAGATMAHIHNYLQAIGRYLVVQPDYPAITLGGCIAVDVHGQGQLRDGNFRHQVQSLKLFHPSRGIVSASRAINNDIFELTCGGYGLTGHIISAKLQTRVLPSPLMVLYRLPIDDIAAMPELLVKAAEECDFAISWHDFSARGAAFGRGFFLIGKFVSSEYNLSLARRKANLSTYWPLNGQLRSYKSTDLALYSLPFNRLTNVLYAGYNRFSTEPVLSAAHNCFFPARTRRQFYYKFFGRAGFHESELIVPVDSFGLFIRAIDRWLEKNELAVTLAEARAFRGTQSLMRFDGEGICFTLNFPRCSAGSRFIEFLDDLTIELGLIPYLAKDSRLPLGVVKHSYQHYDDFKMQLRRYDRERLYRSEFSNRLEL